MTKKELVELLKQLGMAPSKKMGQNFLIDESFLDSIANLADLKAGENILEVGPGFGALTSRLVKSGAKVAAIEFDRKLAAWLRQVYVPLGLQLIEGDACKVDIASIFGKDASFRLISNLPYSAGTVVVANMLLLETPPPEMFVMLQKEVGMRLAAKEDTEEYGSLSVRVQSMYDVTLVKNAPPELFHPQPDVDSGVFRLKLKEQRPDKGLFKTLSTLAKVAFAHRRKKMFKQTASVFGEEKLRSAMAELGIDPDIRAEKISPALFLKLAEKLQD